ncbi:MAG: hypothetical protein QXR17_08740 [Candidatus Bathyarchaeia archaeon]
MLIWDEVFETLKKLNSYLKNCYSVREFYMAGEDKVLRYDKQKVLDMLEHLKWLMGQLEEG